MKKIKLIPLQGVEIEKVGKISFGDSKDSVLSLVGNIYEEQDDNSIMVDDLEMKFDFDDKDKLMFIEVFGPFCEFIEPEILGVKPFKLTSEQLLKLLTERNNGKIDDTEAPYCYAFLNIAVGVWKEVTENDMIDEIKAARESNEYEQWMDDDLKRSKFFWTIGIGEKGYYNY